MPAALAVIVTAVVTDTEVVDTENVALELPCATVTDAGTVAAGSLLDRATTRPPDGAGPVNVTVACEVLPATRLVGFRVRELNAAGVTVRVAVLVTPP